MNLPENLKYTKDHEWISVKDNIGTIGVTDYAQGELGDVVFVDFGASKTEFKKGESFCTIEAVKTVSDVYAPVSGKVIEFNKSLNDSPEKINSSPYDEGWIIKIELTNKSELENLLDVNAYKELIGQ